MPATLKRDGDELKLNLSGLPNTEFRQKLQAAKTVSPRRWDPDEKIWAYPADVQTATKIVNLVQPIPDAEILGWLREAASGIADEITTWLPEDAELRFPRANHPDFLQGGDGLFPFQRSAVEFIVQTLAEGGADGRALLADDMGLGKTVVSLVAVLERALRRGFEEYRSKPKLVIAPAGLAGAWADEIREWIGEEPVIIKGRWGKGRRETVLRTALRENRWIIVNLEQVRAQHVCTQTGADGETCNKREWLLKTPEFALEQFYAVIADEAHRFKNKDSQQTRGLWQIKGLMMMLLTGSPILNNPGELWALMATLHPERYGEHGGAQVGYWRFVFDYEESYEVALPPAPGGKKRRTRVVTGVKNPDGLRFELRPMLVRRTKKLLRELGLLPDKLPTKHVPVPLNPVQQRLYNDTMTALILDVKATYPDLGDQERILQELLTGSDSAAKLIPNGGARIMRLRQIASSPALLGGEDDSAKLDAVVEIVEDHHDKPMVIFTWFKGTAELLRHRLEKRKIDARTFTGDTPQEERTRLTNGFQQGEFQVMIATIAAGGVGQTWTAADTAVFVERDWTPMLNTQAEDRLYRIGQDRDVTIIVVQASGTIDTEEVATANRVKALISGQVFGSDDLRTEEAA